MKNATREKWIYIAAIILLIPALLVNLDVLALIDDEAIRSLVALEMKLSGKYVAPTLNGELYFKKPPLYNWILLAFFTITGRINEFTARFPTAIFLLLYGLTIFHYFKKHYSAKVAFLNAFLFITCGRVLFWDSFLGLIDMCFSWVMFTMFMVVYHRWKREDYFGLFVLSYLLAAVGFLLKGLPSLVFLGTTLLIFFLYKKNVRKLFSGYHLLGAGIFILLVGGYYYLYSLNNPLEQVLPVLFNESARRTVVNYGWERTIGHLFTFPFEMIYHFLPWSLFIVHALNRRSWKVIRRDDFLTYNGIVFLANILIYWASPEVYPRYLLMLAPLIFSVLLTFHLEQERAGSLVWKFFDVLFFICSLLLTLGSLAPLFVERAQQAPGWLWKAILFFAGFGILSILYYRWKPQRLLIFVLVLILFRLAFDWFVLPDRNAHDWGDLCREDSKRVGRDLAGEKLYIYPGSYHSEFNDFYITNERREILEVHPDGKEKGVCYIIDLALKEGFEEKGIAFTLIDEFRVRHKKGKLFVVKF